jgi:peptidoglycan hydrolase CwlO-like protein
MEPDLLLLTLNNLRDDVKSVDRRVEKLDQKLDDKVEDLDKDVNMLKAFKYKIVGMATFLSSAIGYLISYFKEN